MPAKSESNQNVFINCPFDGGYADMMQALVFSVHDCGFVARSALEMSDSSQVRITKIFGLIRSCRFGIHDISRTELDPSSKLPRFNMPLELGIFLGAKEFGRSPQSKKVCLVLDRDQYRYQAFCSDIAGQDIKAHNNDPEEAVRIVRNWLRTNSRGSGAVIPGARTMIERYRTFQEDFPALCRELRLDPEELIFNDYTTLVATWIEVNQW